LSGVLYCYRRRMEYVWIECARVQVRGRAGNPARAVNPAPASPASGGQARPGLPVRAGRTAGYIHGAASKQKDRTDRAYICGSGLVYLWPFRVPTARSSLIAAACIASRPNSRARGIRGGRRGAGAGAGAGAGSHGDSELTGVPAPPRARELPIRQERERERAEITGAPSAAAPGKHQLNCSPQRFFFFVIKEL
jgi:hypothetical protein